MLVGFIAVLLFVSLFVSRIAVKGQTPKKDDYALAGKNVSFLPLMLTFLATQVGGGLMIGCADDAYNYGWWVLLFPTGYAIGLLILSFGVARRIVELKVSTIAEIFEKVYGSSFLRKVCSILSIISLLLIFSAQVIATRKFFSSYGIEQNWFLIVLWVGIITYTVTGGLAAVIATDIVQLIFVAIAFVSCILFILINNPEFISLGSRVVSYETPSTDKLISWLLMPLFFILIEQDMAQRCIAGRNIKTVSSATFVAGMLAVAFAAMPIFFGVLGNNLGVELKEGSSVLMTVVAVVSNPFFTALIGAGTIAAIVSTSDSLLNAVSSNIAYDFGDVSLKNIKVVTALVASLMLFLSFYFDNVLDILVMTYNFSIQCLFVPVVASYIRKKGCSTAAFSSVFCGALGFVLLEFVFKDLPIQKELICLLPSFFGYLSGEVLHKLKNNCTS